MSISKPWGKILIDEDGDVKEHPLDSHCRDVAVVCSALLESPGIRPRMALLAGCGDLDEITCERLTLLAYLHDCGKVNAGFQARCDPKAPIVGHIKPLAALFGVNAPDALYNAAAKALRLEELQAWGEAVFALLDASLSHHGRPWPRDARADGEMRHWRETGQYNPFAALTNLVSDAAACHPRAFAVTASPLPTRAGFVHAYAGLVQLSDWIASGDWQRNQYFEPLEKWAQRRLREIGLDPQPTRAALKGFPRPRGDGPL